jgi:phosphopantothenoylcysteine decarboxylase/phosphopantothenate--cysteine ligase
MHPSIELCCTKSQKLANKKIVLGVTGSIAACETVKLARELIRHGAEVHPVMTSAAQKIIHPHALEFACGTAPITEIDGKVQHVALCGEVEDRCDLLLIAPSTANTISKIAYGIDDTTVTTFATTAIGSKIPVIIIPAMHISMYNHPVVLENIEKLKTIGISVLEPKFEEYKAKMLGNEEIVAFVIRTIGKRDLVGKKTLVIAGSTVEAVDDIRAITNKSSGRTGVELAKNAFERGAEVELWMGRCEVELPGYIPIKRFESTNELSKMTENIDHDIVIVPAAISDYSPDKTQGKIPSGKEELILKLKPNPKIIQKIRKKSDCILVGFKAEFNISEEELLSRANDRKKESDLDLIVANDISKITQAENQVYIIDKDSKNESVSGRKEEISERILDRVVNLC